MVEFIEKRELVIVEILDGGSIIILQDESKWKIAPYFKVEVFDHWRHGDRVTIEEVSDDPAYSWTLFNIDDGVSVNAKNIYHP